ncbi:hypothetical protein [Sphingomonas sp.]|jgi:hypothetical protein|uniref:capsular polysaccharide export protein, LipB/KpsS family n=1 Tax=Sphingomonas sp. TaxID=28214 RepID=UPI002DEEE6F9|nr:hypothetical protein [Sphingomonas sp.]
MQLLIVTLAEYQTVFWVNVAQALAARGFRPRFLSFDDRSAEMIERAGLPVVLATDAITRISVDEQEELFARAAISGVNSLTTHERLAFNRTDSDAMRAKLAGAVKAAGRAIEDARAEGGEVVMVQEVGGFLSVIGSYYAARAAGVDNLFIEPSFFRGRMMLTKNSFRAPQIQEAPASPPEEMLDYIRSTLSQGAIVIPEKDAHQYRSAFKKVVNLKNGRRLVEKAADKYLRGKRQEFGFIGHHVRSHLGMILNSRRLRPHYTPLQELQRFIYYPLHVPGDMALTIRSPQFLDQLALVDYLCRTLPDGYRLALKEHPAMVGAIGSERMIELLRRYDNLALLPPTTNNYQVMARARAVVTVNSKSGAEAGLLGKRVLVLGDAFYNDAPFALSVRSLTELPEALTRELDRSLPDHQAPAHLEWFARVWRESYPGELFVPDIERAEQFADSLASALTAQPPAMQTA